MTKNERPHRTCSSTCAHGAVRVHAALACEHVRAIISEQVPCERVHVNEWAGHHSPSNKQTNQPTNQQKTTTTTTTTTTTKQEEAEEREDQPPLVPFFLPFQSNTITEFYRCSFWRVEQPPLRKASKYCHYRMIKRLYSINIWRNQNDTM